MSRIVQRAKIDAAGWRRRNPEADLPGAQVILNHYSFSRAAGHLGQVPAAWLRGKRTETFEAYRDAFLAEVAA